MGDTGTDQRALCKAAPVADAAGALADADAVADASARPPTWPADGAAREQPLNADASPPGLEGLTLAETTYAAASNALKGFYARRFPGAAPCAATIIGGGSHFFDVAKEAAAKAAAAAGGPNAGNKPMVKNAARAALSHFLLEAAGGDPGHLACLHAPRRKVVSATSRACSPATA